MPYLRKGNPYNAGYAVPRYVETERERRAIGTKQAPRRTIGAPQAPPSVTPYVRRRTVDALPPPDFVRQNGRVVASNVLGPPVARKSSLGSVDDLGSLGGSVFSRPTLSRRGGGSLGEDPVNPTYAPPGVTTFVPTATTTVGTRVVSSAGTAARTVTGAIPPGTPPAGINRDGFDITGHFVGYSVSGMDAQDKADFDAAISKAKLGSLPWQPHPGGMSIGGGGASYGGGMTGNLGGADALAIEKGQLDFKRYRVNGILVSRFFTKSSGTGTLRVAATKGSVIDWAQDLVADIINELHKLGCAVVKADITALVAKAGPGAKAADLAKKLCGGGGGGDYIVEEPKSSNMGLFLIGGAALAAYLLSRRR